MGFSSRPLSELNMGQSATAWGSTLGSDTSMAIEAPPLMGVSDQHSSCMESSGVIHGPPLVE